MTAPNPPFIFLEDRQAEIFRPPQAGVPLWRYMSLARLAALCAPQQGDSPGVGYLWFSRADQLGDPFEGTTPKVEVILRDRQLGAEEQARVASSLPRWAFVNCWHQGDQESAALWGLYSGSEGGVCIKSSYERLRKALEAFPSSLPVGIGTVRYIDYDRETFTIETFHIARAYLHKRKSFDHEREVRAVAFLTPPQLTERPQGFPEVTSVEEWEQQNAYPGMKFRVWLPFLIESVFVSPDEPSWVVETVEKMLRSWGLAVGVRQSRLNDARIF